MTVSEARLSETDPNNGASVSAGRRELRYAVFRPALDACAAFGLFVLVSLALTSAPSSASPHRYLNPIPAVTALAYPALAVPGDLETTKIAFKSSNAADGAVYRQTDATASWLLVAGLPRRASMAYSTSKIEFLVAMPISMIRPIRDGIEKLLSPISSAANAPPSDSGNAAKIVNGCKKSLNSSTSTM